MGIASPSERIRSRSGPEGEKDLRSLAHLFAVAVIVAAGTAEARTFQVDSTLDAVDANTGDGVCATATGTCTLRAAVMESNNYDGTDMIRLPAGTYTLTIPPAEIDASYAGALNVDGRVSIRGDGPDATIIDANGIDQAFKVGRSSGLGSFDTYLQLRGLTIRNGVAANTLGGAIVNFARRLRLLDVTVENNRALLGGAIDSNGGRVDVVRSRIVDNEGTACCGGIRALGNTRVRLVRSEVSGNVSGGAGGGIFAMSGVDLLVKKTEIAGNEAGTRGGGVVFTGEVGRIFKSAVSGNRSVEGGGGVIKEGGGPLLIKKAEITGNVADTGGTGFYIGGGIISGGGDFPVLIASVVTGNTVGPGTSPDCAGYVVLQGGTVIGDPSGCSLLGSN